MRLIFNSSLPRSGSELLQVLLHQNPQIYGSATSPLAEYLYGARSNRECAEARAQDSALMRKAFTGLCDSAACGYYGEITDRPIVIDKSRAWLSYYEWIHMWNPKPKIICMVRDIRSVVGSMERIFQANRDRPIGPEIPAKLFGFTVDERASFWIRESEVGIALRRIYNVLQRGTPVLFVRYEDLTNNPDRELARVYSFIGSEAFSHDYQNIVKQVYENSEIHGPFGDHTVASVLKPAKPFDWASALPKNVAQQVARECAWFQDKFNYL